MLKKSTLVLTILFLASSLSAQDPSDKVWQSFKNNKPRSGVEKAKQLGALGSLSHQKGDYKKALNFYSQSISLRKKLGMDHNEQFANMLFLSSIAHFRSGQSCTAYKEIQNAISVYRENDNIEQIEIAQKEAKETYLPSCDSGLMTKK